MPKFNPKKRLTECDETFESGKLIYRNMNEAERDDEFIRRKSELVKGLNDILINDFKEVKTVSRWVDYLNSCEPIVLEESVKIEFNSLFIHGFIPSKCGSYPSGVKFKLKDDETIRKELADLIFIYSLYQGGEKVCEKVTFNQAKWLNKSSNWVIEENQLYLLSKFPKFKGVKNSIIPNEWFELNPISDELGSFGLMSTEDFVFLGAKDLVKVKKTKKSINRGDIDSSSGKQKKIKSIRTKTDKFILDFIKGEIGEKILCNQGNYNQNVADLFDKILDSITRLESAKPNSSLQLKIGNFLKNYGNNYLGRESNNEEKLMLEPNLGIIQVKVQFGIN